MGKGRSRDGAEVGGTGGVVAEDDDGFSGAVGGVEDLGFAWGGGVGAGDIEGADFAGVGDGFEVFEVDDGGVGVVGEVGAGDDAGVRRVGFCDGAGARVRVGVPEEEACGDEGGGGEWSEPLAEAAGERGDVGCGGSGRGVALDGIHDAAGEEFRGGQFDGAREGRAEEVAGELGGGALVVPCGRGGDVEGRELVYGERAIDPAEELFVVGRQVGFVVHGVSCRWEVWAWCRSARRVCRRLRA